MNTKQIIKKYLPYRFFIAIRKILYPEKIDVLEERMMNDFLTRNYGIASPDTDQKIIFRNAEFKVYSKHGNDGILAFLFSKIGVTNRTFVEVGVEQGRECNTANLALNFGWNGLMIDADDAWLNSARAFYKEKLGARSNKVKIATSFVTAENINQTIIENDISGEIDLLSIDIDSNDYFVWKNISIINPRVVVMEYNAAFGLNSVTMKYDPKFHFQNTYKENPLYFGVSLPALAKLASSKGYALVACDSHGHDAFFVRKDVVEGKFKQLTAEESFYPNPVTITRYGSIDEQFNTVKHLPLEEVL
ncbi:MAG TPA: hypothetical protein VK145_01040 [Candidatus Nanoarchaeia archaeon]|nr:hypothetical protein [Candidatus Nanoarchaeia archaeon]